MMPDRERFQRVAALFEAARSVSGEERDSVLANACRGDRELADEVRRLLRHHDSTHGPLQEPITPAGLASAAGEHGEFTVPTTIGEYRVCRLVGSGGMGAVYLAEQQNPKRQVALKVMRPGVVSRDALRRFQFEAMLLGRLRHPGIAQIYEAGTYDDGIGQRPYFAMEYIDGVPLLQYPDGHQLTTRAKLELIADVCDAVQHAHQHGVIHRDLKPGNILVDRSGQPKVMDFGVARSIDESPHSLATKTGVLIGTIGYMSPEQIDGGHDAVDTRTDIHALGVILYEMLAGRQPYDLDGTTMAGALQRIREDAPTLLGQVNPSFRGDLETICAKALDKDKARRYQSASDLRGDIQRYLRHEPIIARPPSAWYQLRKLAQRKRPHMVAAATVILAMVGTLVALSVAAYKISRERDEAIAARNDATGATTFLNDVLSSLDPRRRASPSLSLTEYLEDITERLEAGQLADQPRVEAMVRLTVGTAYRELGKFDQARQQLERSLMLFRSTAHTTRLSEASVLSGLGAVWMGMGDLERGEKALKASIALFEMANSDEHAGLAGALHTLATIKLDQRRVDDAEALLRRSIAWYRAHPSRRPEFLARTLTTFGGTMRLKGRSDEARQAYEEAIRIQRGLRDQPGLEIAQTMSNLAVLHMYEEDLDAAQPLLEEALAIRKSYLPENHPDIAHILNSLGGLHSMRKEWDRAIEMYGAAVDMRTAAHNADHYSLATPLTNLGVAYRKLGRHREATAALERAVVIRREAHGDGHVLVASPLSHLALVLVASGEFEAAVVKATEMRAIYLREYGDDSIKALTATSILGHCLSSAGRFPEAEALLLAVHRGLEDMPDPPIAAQRAFDRNRKWVAAMYRAWNEVEPDHGFAARAADWEKPSPRSGNSK